MRLELDDIVNAQSEMLNALRDYMGVLKMPNCNTCVKGLDICPGEGEPLRINCPAYHDKSKGERPNPEPAQESNAGLADVFGAMGQVMGSNTDDEVVVDSGVCEPADRIKPGENVPDDSKLLNYIQKEGANE